MARLALLLLFMALWGLLWLLRIPMPSPFLLLLITEALFFVAYWRAVFLLPNVRSIEIAHYVMLGAEIVFHTSMVYFLGGISWLGAFAYVFGLIFSNAFLDLRRGIVYTSGASLGFASLVLLEATGTIPHYQYLEQGPLRYTDPRFVATTLICAPGVFFSIYAWVNWVGYQLRIERDSAIRAQDDLLRARTALQQANEDLEERVKERTAALQFANAALRESEQQLHLVLETCPDPISIQEPNARYRFVNIAFTDVLGYKADHLIGQSPADLIHSDDLEDVRERFRTMVSSGRPAEATYRVRHADGHWVIIEANGQVLVDGDGQPTGVVVVHRDVTERKRAESLLAEQRRVLELVAVGAPIEEVLETLVLMIEEQGEDVLCSVLLVNEDGTALVSAAAPSLPERYNEALKPGVPISPTAGSCGTAASRRQPVIVSDIGSDPLWDEYRSLALNNGLQACWSTPIFSSSGDVVGTFAMYYGEPRSPDAHEHRLVAAATHIAGIAIERKRAEQALRDSEERLRTLIEGVDAIVWEADAKTWQFTFVSRQAEELLGYPVEQWSTDPNFWAEHVYPDDREYAVDFCTRATAEGRDHEFDYRMVAQDGRAVWLHDVVRVVTDGEGKAQRLRGVMVDITERKRAEQALRDSEERYRELFDNANDILYTHDLTGRFTSVNRVAEQVTGYTREEALKENIATVVAPEYLEMAKGMIVRKLRGEPSSVYELEIITKDGRRVPLEVSTRLIYEDEKPVRVQGIARDITERKRAEEALQESEETLKATIESTADGILVVDHEGQIVYANARFASMWRIPASLLETRDDDKLLAFVLDQLQDPEAFLSKVRELYQSSREDLDTLLFKDGRVFERYSRPLMIDGQTAGRVWSFRDVTERKRAEEALRQSESKFRTLVETISVAAVVFQGTQMRYANAATETLTGYSRDELLTMDFERFIHPDSRELIRQRYVSQERGEQVPPRYEIKILTKGGEERWIDISWGVIEFEGEPAMLAIAFDITERKQAEAALQEAANHDPLTGLLNRRAGLAAIEERLAHTTDTSGRFAVLVLDLDRFKSINDSYNHETGDAALLRFAQVMIDHVDDRGVICRLGGDEFEIGLDGASLEQALVFAEELRRSLHRSLRGPGASLPEFKVSTGIACYPEDGTTPDELGRHADEAMYAAKAAGGDRSRAWRRIAPRRAA